jgi:K+-transporting ATPase ATPase A chain
MSDTTGGLLTIAALIILLAAVHKPFGDYMAHVFTSPKHWRVEQRIYRLLGVNANSEQSARSYTVSVLGFSLISTVVLFLILIGQKALPFDRGLPGMPWDMGINTAVSFVTNTNWQSYSGESTLGFAAQAGGLVIQNFMSAAVGLAVAIALIRGFVRSRSGELGNFWVDLVRGTIRILLPLSFLAAILLISQGVIQNFGDHTVHALSGGTQVIPGGPVASQEAIKELGTNGGGFFNGNSSHPFENGTPFSNLIEIFLLLVIPFSLTRTLGTMVGSRKQGYAILGAMTFILSAVVAITTWAEVGMHSQAARLAGGSMEGKETQFGNWASTLFASGTTGTSTGAINSAHDSMSPTGGGTVLVNIMLGEISPGGVGTGIYGILVMAVVTVFIAGLMVGRTPEFLGKKIGTKEMTYVALYTLATPSIILVGVGVAIALHGTPGYMNNPGSHGFSEVVYAFTSAANNNGSAFAGITVTSHFFQLSLAAAMLLGRFIPIALALGLAGSLAKQGKVPATAGTLPTHTPLFASLLVGVILLITGLTFFPALALGPLAEALS